MDADLAGAGVALADDASALTTALTAAAIELRTRIGFLSQQPAANVPEPQQREWATRVLAALLGPSLPVVGPLAVPADHPVRPAAAAAVGDVSAWLARTARVRSRVRELHLARLLGTVATAAPNLAAWRLPVTSGSWTERVGPAGSTSVVAFLPAGSPWAGAKVAGLLLDEWAETMPRDTVDTSVMFHALAPSASPPQLLLLALPPRSQEEWSIDALERILDESLHLARLRAVEHGDLGATQLLPMLFSSVEPAGGQPRPGPPDGLGPDILT